MGLFEQRIGDAMKKRKVNRKLPLAELTVGDIIDAVFSVDNEADAKAFYEGYVAYLNNYPEDQRDWHGMTAERVARSNLSYCFRENMKPERIQMWSKAIPICALGRCHVKNSFYNGWKPDGSGKCPICGGPLW
jgi:hypothetical protein